MMDNETNSSRRSHYPEEDKSPTTTRELRGWYAYSIASEVFAVCGVGSFLPVTLEQLAREHGVLKSDGITACTHPAVSTNRLQLRDNAPCVVNLLGARINTNSFALYTFSSAVFVQAVMLISISAIADHGGNRKRLLLILAYTGATACMLFITIFPAIFFVGSLLAIVGVACLGNSIVLLNAFLPVLVTNHPSIDGSVEVPLSDLGFYNAPEEDTHEPDPLPLEIPQPAYGKVSPALELSNQVSSKGVGLGYAAAVLVQIISIAILVTFNKLFPAIAKSTIPMRVILFVVGLWWAAFTIPTALWLRQRPGPPLPPPIRSKIKIRQLAWLSYISFAWVSLWKTVLIAVKLRQIMIFLAGWFLLSDAVATMMGSAILFAKSELQVPTEGLAGLSIIVTISGILGAFSWPKIGRRFNWEPKFIVIVCVCLFEIIPLYGLLGFLPFIKAWGVGGLQQQWEIFPTAFVIGFVMGGLSSYCRSLFATLVPRNREAAFFALYAVTDKGSSVIGPTIVGRIVDMTGHIRLGFWFLAVMILLPIPLFWLVDIEKGRVDALRMSDERGKSLGSSFSDEHERGDSISEEREGLLREG